MEQFCNTCGKPISLKARTDVTRFLATESRCQCASAEPSPQTEPTDACPSEQTEPIISIADVQSNLGDRYEVLSLLGQGGMGAVYKVRDKSLDKTFAIKMLNPSLVKEQQSVKRFEQEASAAKNLTHVNLVSVYEYGLGKAGAPFIVMDFLDGQTLAQRLAGKRSLSVPEALDIFIQIAESLVHAHMKGVIHRDIKPTNVLLCKGEGGMDQVRVVDFGIAKVLPAENATSKLTQTGEIFGSPQYMSPEQCLGNPLDARSDIYACGCVMYETVTGQPAFAAENPIKLILKQVNDMPSAPSQQTGGYPLPDDLDYLIIRCLQKDPSHRYQSAQDLLTDLLNIKGGKKLKQTALPIPQPVHSGRLPRNDRLTIPLALVALGAIIAISAVTLFNVSTGHLAPTIPPPGIDKREPGPKLNGEKYHDADELDKWSYIYFQRGDYERAIPLLEFGIKTYKEHGKHYGETGGEDTYLGDAYQHLGKCYLALKETAKAIPNYQKALRLYNKYGRYKGGLMGEAVADYATTLKLVGRTSEADTMTAEFDRNGRLTKIP